MGGPAVTAAPCPDPDEVLALLRGTLEPEERRVVEEHLDGCPECRDLIGELSRSGDATVQEGAGRRAEPSSDPLPLGAVVGRYRITGELGRGGMGVVHRVRPIGGSDDLALKRVSGTRDPKTHARFAREVEALRALVHPGIVRVLEVGEDVDGDLFLVMELLRGEDLAHRMKRGRLPAEEVVRIGVLAAAGLGAAHAAGVVHRDVKPSNLFCCADGSVRVLDFGLALIVDDPHDRRLTMTGRMVGTPSYMAVEQVRANRAEDERTDVWGLAATLYHALAGRVPFAAESVTAQVVRIAMEHPDPLPSEVPRALAEALERAMAKDPAKRWATMEDLARALAGSLATDPRAEEPMALDEEMRLVTALVAIGADAPGARDAIHTAVLRHGGTAVALRGGRMAGLFGAAGWRGDEPARAVRAALDAAGWCERVGVGTGKARWKPGQVSHPAGAAIVAAEAALDAGPPVGGCPETLRRIFGGFEVAGARVVREKLAVATLGVREIGGVEVPMVGRSAELNALQEQVERMLRDRRSSSALVIGQAGIGKSRLVHELRHWLEDHAEEFVLLGGRGDANAGALAFETLRSVIRRRAKLPEGTPIPEARRRLQALVESAHVEASAADEARGLLGLLLGVPAGDGPAARTVLDESQEVGDRIRRAFGDLCAGWAARDPVVCILEDVHAADAASLELFEALTRRLAAQPFLVLATSRPELLATRADVLPSARRVPLAELSLDQIGQIVEHILGRREEAIARRSAGTPYFAEELALAVREGADVGALPMTVQGAVQARLAALPDAERDLLKRAAVLGHRFPVEGVVALGQLDAPGLLPVLRRRDLVLPSLDPELAGCTEWTFRHAVLREVALGLLVPEQAASLHRLAAEWLQARPDAPSERVAGHWDAAGDAARAAPLWMEAAREAHRCGDSRAVVAASARLCGPGHAIALEHAAEHALRMLRVEAFSWLGSVDEERAELDAIAAVEVAAAGAGEPLPPTARADALRRLAYFLERRGRYAEAIPVAAEALALARDVSTAIAAAAHATLAWSLAYTGRLPEAEREADQALVLAAACGDAPQWIRAQTARLMAVSRRSSLVERLTGMRQAAARAESAGSLREIARTETNVGFARSTLGDLSGARAALDRAVAAARTLGLVAAEAAALGNSILVHARLGDPDRGLAAATEAIVLAERTSRPQVVVNARIDRGLLLVEAGEAARGLADADAALAHALEAEYLLLEAPCRMVRAAALHALGRLEEATDECGRALAARTRAGGMSDHELDLLVLCWEVFAATGLPEEAVAAHREARATFDKELGSIDDPELRRAFSENVPAHVRLLRGRAS